MPPSAIVLVNADDFGLHRDINRGILDCIERGRVQSVSFSPIGRALDWMKLRELARHGVRIGIHVTLVGEPWATDGRLFKNWKELARQLIFSRDATLGPIEREIRHQFQLCADNGIDLRTISHLDSHQHVHLMAGVWQVCLREAQKHAIRRIRIPWCPSVRLIKKNLSGFTLQAVAGRRRAEVPGTLPCLGLAQAGNNTIAVLQEEVSLAARAGCEEIELVAHPGVNTPALESTYPDWNFNWTGERDALLSTEFDVAVSEAGYRFPQPASDA